MGGIDYANPGKKGCQNLITDLEAGAYRVSLSQSTGPYSEGDVFCRYLELISSNFQKVLA